VAKVDRKVEALLKQARTLASKYHQLTGKPLGITAEIGEFEAARLLKLKLARAREAGHDAVGRGNKRVQIKSRCIPEGKRLGSQRTGSINLKKKWDTVVLVVMDSRFEPIVLYEASRRKIFKALRRPGSKARNERGQLSISKFKSVGVQVWPLVSSPASRAAAREGDPGR
jgi:hypothetical protein